MRWRAFPSAEVELPQWSGVLTVTFDGRNAYFEFDCSSALRSRIPWTEQIERYGLVINGRRLIGGMLKLHELPPGERFILDPDEPFHFNLARVSMTPDDIIVLEKEVVPCLIQWLADNKPFVKESIRVSLEHEVIQSEGDLEKAQRTYESAQDYARLAREILDGFNKENP